MTFRPAVPGRPQIIEGRWYLARMSPAVVVVDQPLPGYETEQAAWDDLRLRAERSRKPMPSNITVIPAWEIEKGAN